MRTTDKYCQAGLLLTVWLLVSAAFGACGDSEGDDIVVEPEPKGATSQVMVVFGPSQLGDNGYADKVMEGVQQFSNLRYRDTVNLDVAFIARTSNFDTGKAIMEWMADSINPVFGNVYERRLLVLTENNQLGLLDQFADSLRPTDEVLALKVNDDDLDQTETARKLGSRLHGANISAAYSIRRYCHFMDFIAGEAELKGQEVDKSVVNLLRLYPDSVYVYRDSIMETLKEMRGETLSISEISLLAADDELPYSSLYSLKVVKAAAWLSYWVLMAFEYFHYPFCIIDFGSCNNYMDYAQMGDQGREVLPLMIDAQAHEMEGRFYVDRDFKTLVFDWVSKWRQNPIGTMPRMESHGGWDGYCTDNLYGYLED